MMATASSIAASWRGWWARPAGGRVPQGHRILGVCGRRVESLLEDEVGLGVERHGLPRLEFAVELHPAWEVLESWRRGHQFLRDSVKRGDQAFVGTGPGCEARLRDLAERKLASGWSRRVVTSRRAPGAKGPARISKASAREGAEAAVRRTADPLACPVSFQRHARARGPRSSALAVLARSSVPLRSARSNLMGCCAVPGARPRPAVRTRSSPGTCVHSTARPSLSVHPAGDLQR
jgi:hypothetical protein